MRNLIKNTARQLRKDQTDGESVFWYIVRDRRLAGKKFLRQYPILFKWNGKKRFLIADFYCHEAKLIIEVDGGIHEKQKDYDKFRDFVLESMGMKVLRFSNETIINNPEKVEKSLKVILNPPLSCKRGDRGELCKREDKGELPTKRKAHPSLVREGSGVSCV